MFQAYACLLKDGYDALDGDFFCIREDYLVGAFQGLSKFCSSVSYVKEDLKQRTIKRINM